MPLSRRVQALKPSATLALGAKTKQLKAEGKDVISLSLGEPDWGTFDVAKKAGHEAIDNNLTYYTPASGEAQLKAAICEQTNTDLGTDYKATQVTVSTGGKFILFSAMQSLLDEGDEAVVPAPYWVSYPSQVQLAGGVAKVIATTKQNGFKLRATELEAAITDKTKLLLLNSPSNPTGNVYTLEELKDLAEVLRQHPRVIVLSDDLYNRLVFEGRVAPHLLQAAPDLGERTVVINGASKVFSMTGWRVGWALGPEKIIGAMTKYQSQSVSCASSISQHATVAALRRGHDEVKSTVVKLRERRDRAYALLSDVPGVQVERPQGAFYIWPDVSAHLGKSYKGQKLEGTADFSRLLLDDKMVATVPGVEFGCEGYIRLSYIVSDQQITKAITRLREFIEALQ